MCLCPRFANNARLSVYVAAKHVRHAGQPEVRGKTLSMKTIFQIEDIIIHFDGVVDSESELRPLCNSQRIRFGHLQGDS